MMIDQTLSHYRITSKLGSGGMGDVYLAEDIGELERTVALKVIPAELAADPQRMQRFVQEARAVSALNHPNILTVFEFGQEGETRFIATEYVEGKTLRQYSNEASLGASDGGLRNALRAQAVRG
ncbi:MAG: protein kinase [Blastocatellia bacterium]|nr:protein kinase [Blastocatellia bacterium]